MPEFDYRKISDDVYHLGKNLVLRMNVTFNQLNDKGQRILYHREFKYSTKNNTTNYSIKRTFTGFLSLENVYSTEEQNKDYIMINMPQLMLLRSRIKEAIEWFDSKAGVFFKDQYGNMHIKENKYLLFDGFPENKFIKFIPIVVFNDAEPMPGIRVLLNSEDNYTDVKLYVFMGFIQMIFDINPYIAASNILAYLGHPQLGSNVITVGDNNNAQVAAAYNQKPKINRKLEHKNSKSTFFDLGG